jgi:hypothetical protein
MNKKFTLVLLLITTLLADATELKRDGWNLISICQDINSSQVDMSRIEEIQNQSGESIYTGEYKEYSNLDRLEAGYGYWVKGEKGVSFESGENSQKIMVPLIREGWNLMASCEDIAKSDINMSGIEEIQNQSGKSIYTGEWANYSDLDVLLNGYGHWVKGAVETLFVAKDGLSLPSGYQYQVIDSRGESVEGSHGEYKIVLLADYNESVDAQSNHLSILVRINGVDTTPLHIQSSYSGHTLVVALYNQEGLLVGVSDIVMVNGNEIIDITTNEYTPPKDRDDIDKDASYKGIKIYKLNMPYSSYQLKPLSDSEFNALSLSNKRLVAEKLLSTLFYGIEHTQLEIMISSGTFMSQIEELIERKQSNLAEVEERISDPVLYKICNCGMKTFSNLFHLNMGRDFINRWSAYVLNQTILFSPAYELDTVSSENVCNVNAKLINYADEHYSMRFTSFAHMISEDNWRRFRSPEDNGREMLEIYMMDFNDSKVPITAKALQNWHLSGNDNTLVIGTDENREPLNLFGSIIYDGFDFYSALVKSDRFVETITTRVVNLYFPNYNETKKAEVVSAIVSSQPETFQDILLQIVLSKEYLLYAKRYMSVEERFLSLVKKLDIHGEGYYYFVGIGKSFKQMKQASMEYKLGREDTLPTDTYSVAVYKNFIQNKLLDDAPDIHKNWGWNRENVIYNYSGSDIEGYIDHLFLLTIQRVATTKEREVLLETIDKVTDKKDIAFIVFSYIVRLSEFYRLESIGGAE